VHPDNDAKAEDSYLPTLQIPLSFVLPQAIAANHNHCSHNSGAINTKAEAAC
jgi:hypothetical protein